MAVRSKTFKNELLKSLEPQIIERLQLRPVDLPVNREIEFPGKRIEHLFFLEAGIASMTTTFQDGFQVEVALGGWESCLGTSSMMGTKRSLNRVYMQIAGHGFSSLTELATREFQRGEKFHDLVLRYQQAQFIQSAQTAACNARHTIGQRLSRWLLLCADRVEKDVLPLSHEFISDMLGVTRPGVTVAAGALQDRGLIQYTRGKVQITDRAGLEKLTCECYRVVRDHLSNYAEYDDGFGV